MDTKNSPKIYIVTAYIIVSLAILWGLNLLYQPIIKPVFAVSCPFIIAIAIAFLLSPVISYLETKHISRMWGVIIVSLVFLLLFGLIITLLVPKAVTQSVDLAQNLIHNNTLHTKVTNIIVSSEHILKKFKLEDLAISCSESLNTSGGKVAGYFGTLFSNMLGRISWIIIIPLTTIWLLKDFNYIGAKIRYFIPKRYRASSTFIFNEVGSVFIKYFRGLITIGIIFGITAMLTFALFGIKYAVILGILASILYLIPYIGLFIIIVMTVLCAMLQSLGIGSIIGIICCLIVLNAVFDMIVTPKIAGASVGVHPVLSLFALMLGAEFFGVLGMIIAVPIAASCQFVLGEFIPAINKDIICEKGRYILPDDAEDIEK